MAMVILARFRYKKAWIEGKMKSIITIILARFLVGSNA